MLSQRSRQIARKLLRAAETALSLSTTASTAPNEAPKPNKVMKRQTGLRSKIARLLALAATAMLASNAFSAKANAPLTLQVAAHPEVYAIYENEGRVVCAPMNWQDALAFAGSNSNEELHVISPIRLNRSGGLQITLRASSQLENFPAAKAAFLRAAATWESLLQTPISIVIDIDFGPTWFGQPFPANVRGLSNPQLLMGDPAYPYVRNNLVVSAINQQVASLYNSLPVGFVPTDIGDTSTIIAPSALFRVVSLIESVANPEAEPPYWGSPPAIGFNSNFSFDFDPRDGIDADKPDFEAMVLHEMGHVLGFISLVGRRELDASAPLAVSIWDMFRFNPGVTMQNFSTAKRVLSSGGSQVFFRGGAELPLSTGRPDGSGGDGRPASHWKDDAITGQRIGIMNPTFPSGKRQTITLNDLAALEAFGYWLQPIGNHPPSISALEAHLEGDKLRLAGTATDPDADVVQAQVQLLDGRNQVVASFAPFAVDIGIVSSINFELQVNGLSQFPDAIKVTLFLIDSHGNRSAPFSADFSEADPGGPALSNVISKKDRLVIKGKRFSPTLQLEINGAVFVPTSISINETGTKLSATGNFNLRSGSNRVRVISNGLYSNIFVLTL
jgi:hypothetical protein